MQLPGISLLNVPSTRLLSHESLLRFPNMSFVGPDKTKPSATKEMLQCVVVACCGYAGQFRI